MKDMETRYVIRRVFEGQVQTWVGGVDYEARFNPGKLTPKTGAASVTFADMETRFYLEPGEYLVPVHKVKATDKRWAVRCLACGNNHPVNLAGGYSSDVILMTKAEAQEAARLCLEDMGSRAEVYRV